MGAKGKTVSTAVMVPTKKRSWARENPKSNYVRLPRGCPDYLGPKFAVKCNKYFMNYLKKKSAVYLLSRTFLIEERYSPSAISH